MNYAFSPSPTTHQEARFTTARKVWWKHEGPCSSPRSGARPDLEEVLGWAVVGQAFTQAILLQGSDRLSYTCHLCSCWLLQPYFSSSSLPIFLLSLGKPPPFHCMWIALYHLQGKWRKGGLWKRCQGGIDKVLRLSWGPSRLHLR